MSHKDRCRVQVPRELPDWMDGPAIRARAKRLSISYERAKYQMELPRKKK